jgi:hypothetical protein
MYSWLSFQVNGRFMPKIPATREKIDRPMVPEVRKSSNCISVERFSKLK